jgi:hypothetical protein
VSTSSSQETLFELRRKGQRRPLIEEQVIAVGLPEPEPEHRFAAALGRKWQFDYAWPVHRIAFEIEGGAFIGGRHTSGAGFEKDAEKYNRAAILGWMVIRATHGMIRRGAAISDIADAFKARGIAVTRDPKELFGH